MESLGEKSKSSKNFFKYMFNFDEKTKTELLNIIQYSLLAIIPIVIINKLVQKFIPEADEEKGSLEIVAEIVIQVWVIFIGIFFIDRLITYFPTYSGVEYKSEYVTYIITSSLLIILSLQTKVGEKCSILIDRIVELWDGKMGNKNTKNGKNSKNSKNNNNANTNSNVKVSQPISQNILPPQTSTQSGYSDGTSIGQLPNYNSQQPSPDFNNMYQKDPTPLVNAQSPTEGFDGGGIMAANEVLGGGGMFSSW
jgi:hypothetical protein